MLTPGRNRIGTTIRHRATFRTSADALTNPDTVLAKVYSPSGAITSATYGTSPDLGRDTTGKYWLDHTPDQSGRWHIRWEASVAGSTLVIEDDFIVQASPFVDGVSRAYS